MWQKKFIEEEDFLLGDEEEKIINTNVLIVRILTLMWMMSYLG